MTSIIEAEELREYKTFLKAEVLKGNDDYMRALQFGCFKINKEDESKQFFEPVKFRNEKQILSALTAIFREVRAFNRASADEWFRLAIIKSRRR